MYKTLGFILKKEDKGENDQLLTVFSKEYGKIKILAKSVRKNKSKLAHHVSLFSLVDFIFVLGKAYNVLTSAYEIKNLSYNTKLDKKVAIYSMLNLVEKYTIFNNKDSEIFFLLELSLDYLSSKDLTKVELKYFLRYFEYRFLDILGYKPKEKEIELFFDNKKGQVDVCFLDDLEGVFLRYFNNIL